MLRLVLALAAVTAALGDRLPGTAPDSGPGLSFGLNLSAPSELMQINTFEATSPLFYGPHTSDKYTLPPGASRLGGCYCRLQPSHAQRLIAAPPGVSAGSPEADRFFRRWLQCSSANYWCTWKEVLCGCRRATEVAAAALNLRLTRLARPQPSNCSYEPKVGAGGFVVAHAPLLSFCRSLPSGPFS